MKILWTKDKIEEFKKLYPDTSENKLLEIFPYKSWKSLTVQASRLRKEGHDIPIRKIQRLNLDKAPHLNLSKIERVDLARMIDTDGHIGVSSGKSIRVGFTNIDRLLLNHFVELCSINNKKIVRKRGNNRNPTGGVWTSRQINVYAILREIIDDLIAKKKRGKLAMKFIELKSKRMSKQTYHQGELHHTKEEIELINQIKYYNQNGENRLGMILK